MKKLITFLMTFLVGVTTYANADMGNVCFEAGYRHDNEDWKTDAGHSSSSLSRKTKFKDIDIFQIGVRADADIGYNLYLRGGAYWGWVLDGKFEEHANAYDESGLACDSNVQNRFSIKTHNNNIIDERHVYGADAAIGYPIYFCDCTMMAAPVVGYAYDHQNFWVEDEGLTLNNCGFPTVNTDGCCCKRKYHFSWYGPFVGADFRYRPYNECWNLYAGFEYHFATFHGKKHNFNDFDFNDSNHRRSHNAHGWVVNFGADYDFCETWTVGVNVKIRDFYARKHGHHSDESSSSDSANYGSSYGTSFDSSGRRKNEWDSYAVNLTFGRQF
jgi:Protochlamydia outer membrane protein